MMTELSQRSPARRAADLTVSIILMVIGVIALVLETVLDAFLTVTSADSPGNVAGMVAWAFVLLLAGGFAWLATTVVAIVVLVRRRTAWWIALIGMVVPLACGVGGFLAVMSVVP